MEALQEVPAIVASVVYEVQLYLVYFVNAVLVTSFSAAMVADECWETANNQ